MKKKIENKTLIFIWILIGLWLSCLIVSMWWFIHNEEKNLYDILFPAINAMFSCLAIIVAYISLIHKNKTFSKQLDVNTFTETIQRIIDSSKCYECRMYILSNLYISDIECAKSLLRKKNIYLNDIKNLCCKNKNSRLTVIPAIEDISTSYKNIVYFCSEMEYLGTLYGKGVASEFILEYYGELIIETYEKLSPILSDPNNSYTYYPRYKSLYNHAKIREYCQQSLEIQRKKK